MIFTGKERDSETQLDFFQARYLSGAQQRFMSADPGNAGADPMNPQSWNAYAYVNNNPLNATDPTGMFLSLLPPKDKGEDDDGGYNPGDPCLFCLFPPCVLCFGTGGGAPAPEPPPPPFKITVTVTANPPKSGTRTGNYPTLDCDGYRAVRGILPQTTKQGIEFGGFLYQNSNGRYSYSNPVAGEPTSIPDLFKSPQAFVSGIVGWFHTHPLVPGFNNDRFSGSDLLITRKEGPGYLGTASGRILKLAIDPKGLPHTTDVNSGTCQVP
jgi:RHS repeat-associated protein